MRRAVASNAVPTAIALARMHVFARALRPDTSYELGILAGVVPLDPLTAMALSWPHDGRLELEDTKVYGMTDFALIQSSHDLITFHPWALYQTQHFLRKGHFVRPIPDAESI